MSKKNILESLEAQIMIPPDADAKLQSLLQHWESTYYGALSVLLANLRFLALLHQFHHWTVSGSSYYGDHLLFQRLYEGVTEEIDSLAERAIGLGSECNVDLRMQFDTIYAFIKDYSMAGVTYARDGDLAYKSLDAEYNFLRVAQVIREYLDANGMLTGGLEDLLPAIEGKHEEHIYLLKQRVGG